ncbi:hypothetical protein BC826DRAFT_1005647 [Russula brevipes]|nr:hypothetical protein BC826DRAFT_1005647 [Russula brevipes]
MDSSSERRMQIRSTWASHPRSRNGGAWQQWRRDLSDHRPNTQNVSKLCEGPLHL